jgi:hypothetical protein
MNRLMEYLNRRQAAGSSQTVHIPPPAKTAQLVRPEDAVEVDFSIMKDDVPSIKPINRRARHQLANNMFWAGLRSAFREASFFAHRMIDRTDPMDRL